MVASATDHATETARARIGTVLHNKWHIDALLGVGGMASVYAATHRNGKRAAVKVLHASAAHDPIVRARFLREGYVANRVEHPGSVSILDDDVGDDGTVFLVMELLIGETVEDRRLAHGGTLPPGDVLAIAEQVLDVLAAAHGKHIVHRDLKPGNLFLTREGAVKVLDFGIARLADMKSPPTQTTSFSSSMGTLGFMAPEQARGRWEQVDARTDLWSVGATMYTLVSGRFVHEAQTANEQLLEAMTKPAPPLASVVPGVDAELARVVDRALAFERDDRWADARAMQQAVRAAYEAMTGRPLGQSPSLVVSGRASQASTEQAPTMPAFSGPGSGPGSMPNLDSARRAAQAITGPRVKKSRRSGAVVAGLVAVLALAGIALGVRRGSGVQPATPPSSGASLGTTSDRPATVGARPADPSSAATTAPPHGGVPDPAPATSGSAAAAPEATTRAGAPSRRGRPHAPAPAPAPAVSVSSATATTPSAEPSSSGSVDIFERRR